MGVEVDIKLNEEQAVESFLDDFIEKAIESHCLSFGGGGKGTQLSGVVELGYVATHLQKRDWLVNWLSNEPRIKAFKLSEPLDLWHNHSCLTTGCS